MYFISLNNNSYGDLNNDSILNIYDIIILVELVLNDNYSALIDTNSDCSLDIVDVVDIVTFLSRKNRRKNLENGNTNTHEEG